MSFADLLDDRSVIVCCGTGGVGKTTTAAAIAVAAARRGRRTVVVTVDPARRLADALGVDELTNEPHRVTVDGPGELWAMMLDAKATFDALVVRYGSDPGQSAQILQNRFYRNISGALSGTHEYMAAEKLYELHLDDRFDLIVVDTPPTRHALDILDAPEHLARFLDHRIYRALMVPTRMSMRAANVAAHAFLRTVARAVGAEVVADAVAFFQAFDGMEGGFRDRAGAARALLTEPGTAFVVITSARADTVTEAGWFAEQLVQRRAPVAALVVNLAQPRFSDHSAAEARQRADELGPTPTGVQWANLADLTEVVEAEAEVIAPLVARIAPAPVVVIPMRSGEVNDLVALAALADDLMTDDPSPRSGHPR